MFLGPNVPSKSPMDSRFIYPDKSHLLPEIWDPVSKPSQRDKPFIVPKQPETRDSKVTRNKRKREIIESTNMTYSTLGGIPALGAPRMDQRYEMKQNDWP